MPAMRSANCRKRIEEVFGWIKGSAGLAKVKLQGRERVDAAFTLALARLQSDPLAQAPDGAAMTLKGKWLVVETLGYDMTGPGSCILFDRDAGEFVLDCLTGSIHGACEGEAVEFKWSGNNEMDEASGNGWAELQQDGSSKARSAFTTTTTSPSSHVAKRLLQQPAS
jgi:hypothetical protein